MSKFSKVDYVSTAATIRSIMSAVVTAFADQYEADNPRFDRQRFVEACEGGSHAD